MKLDPRHLEILYAIVQQGGLTEGAALLGKSQPSVSRSLSLLEKRVGAPLFEANKRPLRPTDLGRALAAEGRQVFQAGTRSSDLLSQYQEGRSGAVRVGGSPYFLDGVIAGMLAAFQYERPDVRIDQVYGYANDLLPKLSDGSLDFAILPMRASLIPENYVFEEILPGRNVIACRVGHPLTRLGAIKRDDIGQYPWIAPPVESPLYQDLRSTLSEIGLKDFKVSFTGGSLSATINVLTASDALTVLPFSVVFMMRNRRSVGALSIRIGDPDRHLGILTAKDAPITPATRRVISHIRQEFEALSSSILRVGQDMIWRP